MSERYRCRARGECRSESKMYRRLKPTVALLAALGLGLSATQGLHAQDDSGVAAPAAEPIAKRGESVLHIAGDAAALEVEVRQARIADVLSALAGFNIRYRSSIALDEIVDGAYTGSLGRVLSRVLDGYDYAIKQHNAKFEVIVVGKRGEQADSAPIIKPVRQRPSD
jgi:hypothetical protein